MTEPFVAEIRTFGFNFAPRGWALCNGQIMSISQNTALFSLLGTTYGGNGQTTFALPDLRGRVPLAPGQGPGLTPRSLGEVTGAPTHTLIQTEMPAHNHALTVSSTRGTGTSAGGAQLAQAVKGNLAGSASGKMYSTGPADTALAPQTLGIAGGSQPHNNMMPYQTISFCIALEGIYPSRN